MGKKVSRLFGGGKDNSGKAAVSVAPLPENTAVKTAVGGENPLGEGLLSGKIAEEKKKKQASIAGLGEGASLLG